VCELRVRGTSGRPTIAPGGRRAQPNAADAVNAGPPPFGMLDSFDGPRYVTVNTCNFEQNRSVQADPIE
jgi:hypothetical protein